MKEIRLTNDQARSYGYNRLTGEACAYSMRALYELTAAAMQQFLNYSGLNVDIETLYHSPWNNRECYAVMIDNSMIESLIIYAAILEHGTLIKVKDNYSKETFLITGTQEELKNFIENECNKYDLDEHCNIVRTHTGDYERIRSYDATGTGTAYTPPPA